MPKSPDTQHWVRYVIPGPGILNYANQDYDRGQLITLRNLVNDEKLLRIGYVAEVDPKQRHLCCQCGVCGSEFVNEPLRDEHGKRRHRNRFASDMEVVAGMHSHAGPGALRDTTGDAEEKRLMAEAPLYLENTKASKAS